MKGWNKTVYNLGIYVIIIVLFMGKSLYTAVLTDRTQKEHIREETRFTARLITLELQSLGVLEEEAVQQSLCRRNLEEELKAGGHLIWLLGEEGEILYQSEEGEEGTFLAGDGRNWKGVTKEVLIQAQREGEYEAWHGKQVAGLWKQEYLYIYPLGEKLYLVDLNRCASLRGQLRQQYVMQWGMDILILLACIILIANQASKYRKKVVRLATKDELTGLSNRKFFNSEFADYVKREGEGAASLFLLDVDFFKQINDGYGHGAGDAALRFIGEKLSALSRTHGGFAGRWGGDEFIGLLPLCGEEALEVLSQMAQEIASTRHAEGFHITVSVGVAQLQGGEEISQISERVDHALYQSKEQGRNQVTLYQEGTEQALSREEEAGLAAKAILQAQTLVVQKERGVEKKTKEEAPRESLRVRMRSYLRDKLLMSILVGVQWMAPFVAGGGLLIALAFLVDGACVDLSSLTVAERSGLGTITPLARILKTLGGNTFNFMLPVFAGFMAYAIGGEEAFLSGFVGGYLVIGSNSGFVGSMVAGLVAGISANELTEFTRRLPKVVRRAAPILIYPVFDLLLVELVSVVVITPIASAVGVVFTRLLTSLVQKSPLLAGGFSAMMMAVDMGGIINKVAYNYGVSGLEKGMTDIMATVMAGGMVPPLGVYLSVFLFPEKYARVERERGLGTLFMGLSFITEGTLLYVFTDFVRVIPACMAGSLVSGLLSMSFGCRLMAPHGGIFVLPVMENPILYLVALLTGALLTGGILGVWKKDVKEGE